jgi:photosystem II stability/assembly factor-like uncharacterized protein
MKKISGLITFLFISASFINFTSAQVYTDWQWKHPTPQGNALRWVKAWDANNWYAIGFAGTFMKTSNAGANWYFHHKAGFPYSEGSSGNLYTAYFFNQNTGIVAGSSGAVLRTTNAGINFDTVTSISSSGTIYSFYFINNTTGFLAGSSTVGLYRTTNAGTSWTMVNTPSPSFIVYDVYATDLNNIRICSLSANFYYTTNGGNNWTTVSTGAAANLFSMKFVNPNTGFVTGIHGTFRLTTNGGLNWTNNDIFTTDAMFNLCYTATSTPSVKYYQGFDSAGFPPLYWRQISVLGSNTWEKNTTFYLSPPASAFINYQGSGLGEDWLISNLLPVNAGDSIIFFMRKQFTSPFPPDSLIVRTSTDTALGSFINVLKRIDVANLPANIWVRHSASLSSVAGQSVYIAFQHKDNNGNGMYLDSIIITTPYYSPNEIFTVGENNHLFKTTNLGLNWITINCVASGQIIYDSLYSMDINGNLMIVGGNHGMLNISSNAGINWTTGTYLKYNATYYDVFAETNNGNIWVVGRFTLGQDEIIYSSNGGSTWVSKLTDANNTLRSIQMLNSSTGYVCGIGGLIMKTTDAGNNWVQQPYVSGSITINRIDFLNVSTGFVFCSNGHIYKTINGGSNWEQCTTGTTMGLESGDFVDVNTGWGAGGTGIVIKTTNSGASWIQQNSNFTGTIYELRMANLNTGYFCGGSGTIRKTTNSGANWDTISSPVNIMLSGLSVIDANNIFIGGINGFIGFSSNSGQSWNLQNTGGSDINSVYMRSVDSGWAVGANGFIHKLSKGLTQITEWENKIPNAFSLSQNYPNPFNPMTTIEFGLVKSAKVSLKIYDITGREIETMFNGFEMNPGTVKYRFDGTNFSSGVYFYSLVVDGNLVDTKRMAIIK